MTTDGTIVVGGIPIPSDDPVFLAALAVHVPAAIVCVAACIVAMLSRKRAGPHPTAGSIYYWSLSVVFATATALSVLRWAESYHLFFLGVLAFAAASLGRTARRRRWPAWVKLHIVGMGASYALMLTAFYVDNGKNLPFWRELPQWAFWVLPVAIGAPLITHALLRHPLVRQARTVRVPTRVKVRPKQAGAT